MKIHGVVQKHLGRGRKLGYPTANLSIPDGLILEEGIYLAMTNDQYPMTNEKLKLSLAFVGAAETFGDTEKKLEVYILDFDKDLYGREIEVKLLKKLRENIKFNTEADLIDQMKQDERDARDFFKTYGRTE